MDTRRESFFTRKRKGCSVSAEEEGVFSGQLKDGEKGGGREVCWGFGHVSMSSTGGGRDLLFFHEGGKKSLLSEERREIGQSHSIKGKGGS